MQELFNNMENGFLCQSLKGSGQGDSAGNYPAGIAHLFLQKELGNNGAQLLFYLYYLKDFHLSRGPQSSHFSPASVTGPPWPLPDTHAFGFLVVSVQSVLVEICCKAPCWEACGYGCRAFIVVCG